MSIASGALRYRAFPVFSGCWLAGRSVWMALGIGLFALASALGTAAPTADPHLGALVGLHLFTAFMLMALAGPALATWVRGRRWPLPRERAAVVAAVLLGLAVSYFADAWASAFIEARVHATLAEPGAGHGAVLDPQSLRGRMAAAPPMLRAALLTLNVAVLLAVYGALGGGLALRRYFAEHRAREREAHLAAVADARATQRMAEMRLGVLQAQVEPHFLFNTLAAIRALLRQHPARAEDTLDALVAYLRASIPRLRDDAGVHGTLGDQVDLCSHYLDVMRLRSGGRISCEVDIDPVLRDIAFPPLLLLTLVENAVKHGLEPKRGPGRVRISARRDADRLRVDVADDGVGLQVGQAGGGLGLANVRAQLQARFGAAALLSLQGQAGGGTLARIEIPVEAP